MISSKTRILRLLRDAALFLVIAAVGSACKKSPAPAAKDTPATDVRLPMPSATTKSISPPTAEAEPGMERALDKRYGSDTAKKNEMRAAMKAMDAQGDAEEKLAKINHQTMVIPAPPDYKPEPVDRKVRLKLILEKTKIRPGDFLRFRLEMTNVGRQAIEFTEFNSGLFKYGGLQETDRIFFYATGPDGKREKLDGDVAYNKIEKRHERHPELKSAPLPASRPNPDKLEFLPDSMSNQEKEKWYEDTAAMSAASTVFTVKLLPGETLRSRGDGDINGNTFRTLWCDQDFDKVGEYKISVTLDDRPAPLRKNFIDWELKTGRTLEEIQDFHKQQTKDALGPELSNEVLFEVTP